MLLKKRKTEIKKERDREREKKEERKKEQKKERERKKPPEQIHEKCWFLKTFPVRANTIIYVSHYPLVSPQFH